MVDRLAELKVACSYLRKKEYEKSKKDEGLALLMLLALMVGFCIGLAIL